MDEMSDDDGRRAHYRRHSSTRANRSSKLPPKKKSTRFHAKNRAILSSIYRCSPIMAQNWPILSRPGAPIVETYALFEKAQKARFLFKNWTYKGELISPIPKSKLAVLCTTHFPHFWKPGVQKRTFKVSLEIFKSVTNELLFIMVKQRINCVRQNMRTLHKADFTALCAASDFRSSMQLKSATFSEEFQANLAQICWADAHQIWDLPQNRPILRQNGPKMPF